MMKKLFLWIYNSKIIPTLTVMFLLMSVLPLSVALTSYFLTTRSALQEAAEKHINSLSTVQERLVVNWFDNMLYHLRQKADTPLLLSKSSGELEHILFQIKDRYPAYDVLALADETGKIIISTNDKTGISLKEKDFFSQALKGQPFVTEMMIGPFGDKPYLIAAVPVEVDNTFRGVIIGTITIETLNKLLSFQDDTIESFMVDRNGYLMTDISGADVQKTNSGTLMAAPKIPPVTEGLKKLKGTVRYENTKGDLVMSSYQWISNPGILLVNQQVNKEVLRVGGVNLQKSVIMGGLSIIVLLTIAWFGARRISAPLVELAKVVNEISTGNLKARVKPLKANYEIVNLGNQINELANTLDRSMHVIKEQMDELKTQKQEIISQNEDILRAYNKLTRANQSLQQLAITDQLTQTYNRRYFMDRLRNEILLSLRSRRPLSVVLIDIDFFKNINDTYGHKAGDQVLQGLVKLLASLIRRSDLLARFGGEEFIILAPETDLAGALRLAEKIRAGIEKHSFTLDEGVIKITISLGVAELKDFAGSPEKIEDQLIMMADHCLYEAKRLGRNRVIG